LDLGQNVLQSLEFPPRKHRARRDQPLQLNPGASVHLLEGTGFPYVLLDGLQGTGLERLTEIKQCYSRAALFKAWLVRDVKEAGATQRGYDPRDPDVNPSGPMQRITCCVMDD